VGNACRVSQSTRQSRYRNSHRSRMNELPKRRMKAFRRCRGRTVVHPRNREIVSAHMRSFHAAMHEDAGLWDRWLAPRPFLLCDSLCLLSIFPSPACSPLLNWIYIHDPCNESGSGHNPRATSGLPDLVHLGSFFIRKVIGSAVIPFFLISRTNSSASLSVGQ